MVKKLGKVYILGDSYSTFKNCIPKGYDTWYSAKVEEKTDVNIKEDTWWYQLLKNTESNLILNDSFSGTTICNITYNGVYCPDTSFIERFGKRIEEGIFKNNIPDTFFLFGGTNDSWADSPIPIGELKPEIAEGYVTACRHYDFECIKLQNIDKTCGHPNKNGMTQIFMQVLNKI